MLKVNDLKKHYKINKRERFTALKDVSLDIENHNMIAVVGESGSGKSTLLNLLSTIDSPSGGYVEFNGEKVSFKGDSKQAKYRRDNIGFIFQSFNLIKDLTVLENVELPMEIAGASKQDRQNRAMELLKLVGLEDQANKLPGTISGGQKQRVAIARALANNPGLILADEPTGALDHETSIEIMKLLSSIAQDDKKVVIVTHDMEVASYCERIIKMQDGQVIEDYLQESASLEKLSLPDPVKNSLAGIKLKSVFKLNSSFRKKFKRNLLISLATAIALSSLLLVNIAKTSMNNHLEEIQKDYGNANIVHVDYYYWSETGEDNDVNTAQIEEFYKISEFKHIKNSTEYIGEGMGMGNSILLNDFNIYPRYMYPEGIDTFGSKDIAIGSPAKALNEIVISSDLIQFLELSEEEVVGSEVELQFISYTFSEFESEEVTETDKFIITGILTDSSIRSYRSTVYFTADYASTNEENTYVGFYDLSPKIFLLEEGYADDFVNHIDKVNLTNNSEYYIYARRDLETVDMLRSLIVIVSNVFTVVLAISALVASILILVMSYISILERIKEVGVLRAIGARKKDIVRIFMFEAFSIGLVAGVSAVLFSYIISTVTFNVVNENYSQFLLGTQIEIKFSIIAVIATIVFAIILSCISSAISVRRGLKINPAEAIRMK